MTQEMLDRRQPFDLDAEMSVLGSILLDPKAADKVRAILRPEDFFDEANRTLYEHLRAMRDESQAIDIALLVNRLRSRGHYETAGGAGYLHKIIAAVPNAAHAVWYAGVVAEKARLRGIIATCTEAIQSSYDESLDAKAILSQTEDQLFALRDTRTTRQAAHVKDVLREVLDDIDASMKGGGTRAVPTQFTELDRHLGGGLHDGELIIVAARPSVGKSSLVSDFVTAISEGHLSLFFSLEMTRKNLCERMLSAIGQVDGMKLRNRTLAQSDMQKLIQAASELSQHDLWIDDNSQVRVGDIAASVRMTEQVTGRKVELICVDYLQFIQPDDEKANRERQVAKIGSRLKALAQDRQCPVVAVCTVNRKNEDGQDKRPKMSMLRESGGLEYDADVVLLLHREDYYKRGEEADECRGLAEVIIAKQRNGPCDTVQLRWDAAHTRFQNLAPQRAEECASYDSSFDQWNRGESSGF